MRLARSRTLALAAVAGSLLLGRAPTALHAQHPVIDSDPYPLEICVVMKGALPKKAHIADLGEREIRVCCEECVERIRSSAEHWIEVIDERIKEIQQEYYPLDTCVVDGKELDDAKSVSVVFRNRLFVLCSDACRKKLEAEPAKHFAALNRAVIAKQKSSYPLTTCLVTDKPLGKNAVDHVVGNQLVRLADAAQIEVFNQSAGEYLAKLRAALKKPAK